MIVLFAASLLSAGDSIVLSRDEFTETMRFLDRLQEIEDTIPVVEAGPLVVEWDDLGRSTFSETMPVRVAWGPLGWEGVAVVEVRRRRSPWWGAGFGVHAGGLVTRRVEFTYGLDYRALTLGPYGLLAGVGAAGGHVAVGWDFYRRTTLWAGPAIGWRGRWGAAAGIRLSF